MIPFSTQQSSQSTIRLVLILVDEILVGQFQNLRTGHRKNQEAPIETKNLRTDRHTNNSVQGLRYGYKTWARTFVAFFPLLYFFLGVRIKTFYSTENHNARRIYLIRARLSLKIAKLL